MSVQNSRDTALALSEVILSDIEMSAVPLNNIALKASRLARLVGDFEQQTIMMYESSGYPTSPDGVTSAIWKLAKIAGRVFEKKEDDKISEYAKLQSIELLELELMAAKARLAAAIDPSVSISSANPVQVVRSPMGNAAERSTASGIISERSKLIAQRRSYIHSYVCNVYYELKFSGVSSDIFERTRERVDKKVGEVVPDAIRKFASVYENLLSENDEDWSNAVHSCRRILQDTADGVYPAREDKVIEVAGGKSKTIKLGADQYVNRLIAYVTENSSSTRFEEIVGSHLRYLGERLDSIFQAAQKGSHNVISSQDEADRYVIYTYLVVGDILQLKAEVEQKQIVKGS